MIRNYLYNNIQRTSKRWTILCLMLLAVMSVAAQDIIRVKGQVVDQKTGQPITEPITILDDETNEVIVQATDKDGKFAADMLDNITLRFQGICLEKSKKVKLKGQTQLVVKLELADIWKTLGEAEKVVERIDDRPTFEDADMDMNGNWLRYTVAGQIPEDIFSSRSRYVVQPVIHNSTRNTDILGKPVVVDAGSYNRTQNRLYAYEIDASDGDPLAKNITVRGKNDSTQFKNKKFQLSYRDSIYLDNPKDECFAHVYAFVENYRRITRRDTTTIGFGKKNPLRWFDYSLTTSELTDSVYYPIPQISPKIDKGNIDLRFAIGATAFDANDPHNSAEIKKIVAQAQAIQSQQGNKLKVLSIASSSSPDGGYQSNLNLAKKRMDYVVEYLKEQIPEKARKGMGFKRNPSVASWHEVAEMMRKDSLYEEAEMVERVDEKFKDPLKSRTMRKLDFYDELLEKKYLPMLRKVTYEMSYIVKRHLTIAEIKALYNENYKQLLRYEFFALSRAEQDPVQREKILRQALEVYPDFTLAANDLSALLTQKGEPDPEILEPFAGSSKRLPKFDETKEDVKVPARKKALETINCNQIAALIMAGQYTKADTLSFYLEKLDVDKTENTRYVLALNDIFNGRIEKHFAEMAATGKRNEVVMLLAMKNKAKELERAKQALEASMEMPDDDPITHYLRAICYNRIGTTDDIAKAEDELAKAVEMDPKLEETALTDGDLNNLLIDTKTGQRKDTKIGKKK